MNRGLLILLFATLSLIWSSTWMMIKVGLEGAPPFTAAGLRFIIAALLIFAILVRRGIRIPRSRTFMLVSAYLGLFQMSAAYGLVYWAQQHISSGLAAILFSSMPLTVALLARVILGDPLSSSKLLGILVGTAGVVVIFSEGLVMQADRSFWGVVAIMASVFLASLSSIVAKKYSHPYHPFASMFLPILIGGIVLSFCAFLFEREVPVRWDKFTIASIVYLAVLGSVLAFGLYFWLIKHVDVTIMSYQTFIIPIVACVLGWIFLRETVTLRIVVGGILILAGIALALLRRAPGRRLQDAETL